VILKAGLHQEVQGPKLVLVTLEGCKIAPHAYIIICNSLCCDVRNNGLDTSRVGLEEKISIA